MFIKMEQEPTYLKDEYSIFDFSKIKEYFGYIMWFLTIIFKNKI